MTITLTQTGGLMGRTKRAEAEWPGSADEFDALLKAVKPKKSGGANDRYAYFVKLGENGNDEPMSIQAIPQKYASLFDELYQKLKVVE